MQKILEAKDLKIYKCLLRNLGDYTQNFPSTGINDYFDVLAEEGKKLLPKDKKALEILYYILSDKSKPVPTIVSDLLNMRFPSLPIEYRPMIMNGRKKEVAAWCVGGVISDRVKDLVDFKNTGKKGFWCDLDGNKVELIDFSNSTEETNE